MKNTQNISILKVDTKRLDENAIDYLDELAPEKYIKQVLSVPPMLFNANKSVWLTALFFMIRKKVYSYLNIEFVREIPKVDIALFERNDKTVGTATYKKKVYWFTLSDDLSFLKFVDKKRLD